MLSEYASINGNWPAISVPLGLNAIIHVFLYFYYGQSALNPGQRPAWKKNLTQLQLIQFMIGLCHMIVGYLQHGWCWYGIAYELTMIWLFSNFYYQAYLKERAVAKKLEWSTHVLGSILSNVLSRVFIGLRNRRSDVGA